MRLLDTFKGEALLLKTAFKREGLWYVLREGCNYLFGWPVRILIVTWLRLTRGKAGFLFRNEEYRYLYHSYNYTWKNERAFEVPLFQRIINGNTDKRVIEIGNVLRHYQNYRHDVIDLFEKYPGVINTDIVDFFPNLRYDVAISISTFEHIGWDENPRCAQKPLIAIDHVLKNILSATGKLIITVPLGQNTYLDKYLCSGQVRFTNINCMKQYDKRKNLWQEVLWHDVINNEFDENANWMGKPPIILILEFNKST